MYNDKNKTHKNNQRKKAAEKVKNFIHKTQSNEKLP